MEEENNPDTENQEMLQDLDEKGKTEELVELFEELPTPDVVDFLEDKPIQELKAHLLSVEPEDQGRIFSEFNKELQFELYQLLPKKDFSHIFTHMYSDIRADFYQALTREDQVELLPYLDRQVRDDVILLSAYPPETAGGIMTTDFVTIYSSMNAAQALTKIRKEALSKDMIYYIYVVDQSMVVQGIVTLKQLVLSSHETLISDFIQEFFIYAEVNEDRESVAKKIEKYDLAVLPILNSLKQLVGVVSYEEAMDVMRSEQTEDIEKLMGIIPSENHEPYFSTPTIKHFKKRVIWLVSLAAVGIVSGMIINQHQTVLENFIILAMYMPMMAATGGNTGSQAATVIIRALSLGELKESDWLRVIFKEIKISFLLSACIGLLTYLKIVFFSFNSILPKQFSLEFVGVTIAVAIAIQVVSSAIIGAALPLTVRRFGGDPAVVASPAISTIVDITGLLIYFTLASKLLGI